MVWVLNWVVRVRCDWNRLVHWTIWLLIELKQFAFVCNPGDRLPYIRLFSEIANLIDFVICVVLLIWRPQIRRHAWRDRLRHCLATPLRLRLWNRELAMRIERFKQPVCFDSKIDWIAPTRLGLMRSWLIVSNGDKMLPDWRSLAICGCWLPSATIMMFIGVYIF